MERSWWPLILELAVELEIAGIPYTFDEDTALFVHGIDGSGMEEVHISIQWDLFDSAYDLFRPDSAGPIVKNPDWAKFTFSRRGLPITILCYYNSVVATDPYRVLIDKDGQKLWSKSLWFFKRTCDPQDARISIIRGFLQRKQHELNEINANAWNQDPYDAWINRYGPPVEAAQQIRKNPSAKLKSVGRYLKDVKGQKVANLLGSHGSKAVALALLGAKVTVIDVSAENARYATELALEAGVDLRYIVSDVLTVPSAEFTSDYDLVLMELGILHYFIDLDPLAKVVSGLLRSGGRLVLQDFHPVSTKLITSKGQKHKVTGNYFDSSLEVTNVAFTKFSFGHDPHDAKRVQLRKWTLGEIVTSIASVGLFIRILEEEPNHKIDDIGIPKTFTLVAEKL